MLTIWTARADRALLGTGLIGIALGLVCLLIAAGRGPIVQPEGQLLKAATFDGAVGIFMVTLAFILPLAGFSPAGRRRWLASMIPLTLFGYTVETTQIVRGLDPRFSQVAGPVDQFVGGVFFLSAIGIMACFIVLMIPFFRPGSAVDAPLGLALRYGTVAALGGFGIGIVMSALGGPRIADAGNLLPLHAAGFHGLQAVPLIAVVSRWSGQTARFTETRVHLAGLLWLTGCAAIALQSFGGRPVLQPSPATLAALVCLTGWMVLLAAAARGGSEDLGAERP